MTNLQDINVKLLTVHNKYSKIPLSTSTHFATRVSRWPVVRLSRSQPLFVHPASSKMPASNSSAVSTFILYNSPFIQTHKQISNGFRSVDSNSSTAVTLMNPNLVHLKVFSHPSPGTVSVPPESPCIFQTLTPPHSLF